MKLNLWIIGAAVLLLAAQLPAITVDGYAYLSFHSDHSGIRVLFQERSPSAQTDSAFTDVSGYFNIELQPGVYDVSYSFVGFADYILPNRALLFLTTLDPVTLMSPLSGNLSGMLGPGDFQVVDTIRVLAGQVLGIVPGTRLYFAGQYPFLVYGTLSAIGNVVDSILFTRRYATHDTAWGGVRFNYATGDCQMEYCVVEYSGSGGINCNTSNLTIENCGIRHNHNNYGGGIVFDGNGGIRNCRIESNTASEEGGGILCRSISPEIFLCDIVGNNAGYGGGMSFIGSSAHIVRCRVLNNGAYEGGGAFLGYESNVQFTDCEISGNRASMNGGGIKSVFGSNLSLDDCLLTYNSSYNYYISAIYAEQVSLVRCTVSNNSMNLSSGAAVLIAGPESNVINCSFTYTRIGTALVFDGASESQIVYSNFYGNQYGAFQNPAQGPTAIGQLCTINTNGDSSDTYYNIFLDPMFVDTASGDYHLLAGSPCIDAGDPELPLDPDGTVADIGAYYFNQLDADAHFILHPSSFILSCFPNPFNATTTIRFDLARAGAVSLNAFDILGRRVEALAWGDYPVGSHRVVWDASRVAAGVYFVRLESGEDMQVNKLLLLK
jgi:hypothetical protein